METYDLDDKYDYEGKYEGKFIKANSANSKSNISLYSTANHATADDPVSDSPSASNPTLAKLSSLPSCRSSSSAAPTGVKMIQLPKLVLTFLANPPTENPYAAKALPVAQHKPLPISTVN